MVTRQNLIDLLSKWYQGVTGEEEVYDWANHKMSEEPVNYNDVEEGGQSVAKLVHASLCQMDKNLIVSEDAPIYLEFLQPRLCY